MSDPESAAPSPAWWRRWQPWRRLGLSLLALFIIYGNLAVVLHPPMLGRPKATGLPRPTLLLDVFLMTGMFYSIDKFHQKPYVEGFRVDADGRPLGWEPLDVDELLPIRLGFQFAAVIALRHYDMGGAGRQQARVRAWNTLAPMLRERHNRLHPHRQVSAVRIGLLTWPFVEGQSRGEPPEDARRIRFGGERP